MDTNFKRNLIVSFGSSILLLLVSSTAAFISIKNLVASNELVNQSQEIIYNLNQSHTELLDAQTSMRGYLLTGKEQFLEQYTGSEDVVDDYYQKIGRLIGEDAVQQRTLGELLPLKDRFFSYLERRVQAKKQNVPLLAEELDAGRNLMENIRRVNARLEETQQQLLAKRVIDAADYGLYSIMLIIFAALISTFISIVFFMRILRDYRERVSLQSELLENEKITAKRIDVVSTVAGQIAKGNYEVRAVEESDDALGSVNKSLNNMAESLENSFRNLSDKEWLQASIAELNQVMIGEKTISDLTTDIVEYVAVITKSNAAILYIPEGAELVAISGFSYIPTKERERIKFGDGLSGQAAVSRELMEIRSESTSDIKISYALGEMKPAHVVALPLFNDRICGVVEVAKITNYSDLEIEFLNAVADNIAVAITAAQNRERVQELLEETEAQAEELKMQHSELESINSELETQTEKLQASEEELRVQQEELQQTNEELAERSVLLEEKNVEIQKKSEDLELTTRYKSEFLANMSHELRTPLNSILLLSRLLSENNDQNLNKEQVEFATVIQSSGNGLLGLIDEILDLSKIEAGKMDLEFLEVSTEEIADAMRSLFSEVAKQKNIEFAIDLKSAPLVLKTDKMRLEQILKNLISNAIKFTSKGTVTLEIKANEHNPNQMCFGVTDTGIGIEKEQQPLIFEAFKQADGSTKRKYGGTGLGLSISRELAKLLKGEISLRSKIGEGSTFTLCIPIAPTFATSARNTVSIHSDAPIETLNITKSDYLSNIIPDDIADDRDTIKADDKVILIVEDDVNFAKSLLEFSRKQGYKGIVSVRGDYALNLALAYKPIGILLDIQLPIKSGLQVLDELKNNSATKAIPVHMMSSHKLKQEVLLKGAVNFLDKPVAYEQMPDVFAKIEYIVNRKAQKVLIIEDNAQHAKALGYFLDSSNVNSEIKSDVNEGIEALQNPDIDCVILDMGIPDHHAYEILENVKRTKNLENLPIIVFTGKSLSLQEETKIKKYADSIVVKTAHSYQRMLDEVSLFLHIVDENTRGGRERKFKQNPMLDVLHGKTVLVVDDDVRNIYSLTKALESLKMKVITAIDGKEALIALDENPATDVVLLDMMMPNMDGYETASIIRKNKKHKNLPVIAVTAKAMTGDREKCINAGASDYITKPVDIDQLMSLLRVWLYDRV